MKFSTFHWKRLLLMYFIHRCTDGIWCGVELLVVPTHYILHRIVHLHEIRLSIEIFFFIAETLKLDECAHSSWWIRGQIDRRHVFHIPLAVIFWFVQQEKNEQLRFEIEMKRFKDAKIRRSAVLIKSAFGVC